MDSRSGSGLNRFPVNKSADILDHWMRVSEESRIRGNPLSIAQRPLEAHSGEIPDRIEPAGV
jgi:hypothetical protein